MEEPKNPVRRKRSEASPRVMDQASAAAEKFIESMAGQADEVFQSVNADKEPALPDGFRRILESMVVKDVHLAYTELLDALKLSHEALNDKGKLREALNAAEDNARLAHLVYCCAVVEKERWEIDAAPGHGAMWSNAVEMLEKEAEEAEMEAAAAKEKGMRKPPKKAITNEDVRAKAAACFPDQWRRHHVGSVQVKMMVEHLKELSDQWSARCRSLEVLLGGAR